MMGKMKILLLFATVAKGTKPFLIEKPEDQIVNIGDTVELRCVIGGRRVPEYVSRAIQWIDQSRGQTINTFNSGRRVNKKYSERFLIVGEESRGEWHLRIENITSNDSGRFQCQLHHGNGDGAAKVLVRVPPKQIKFDGIDRNGNLAHQKDQLNTVKCFSFDARPAAQIRFYFRGEELEYPAVKQSDQCKKSSGFCNSTAEFEYSPIDSRASEEIECRVFHESMSNFSLISTRTYPFQAPSVELIGAQSGQSIENTEEKFECVASGHPQPSVYYWSINQGSEEKSDSPIKYVKTARRENNLPMKITCRAETIFYAESHLSKTSVSMMKVFWGPELNKFETPSSILLSEGETTTLTCPFVSYPPGRVTWFLEQNGHKVEQNSNDQSTTIKSASSEHDGNWICSSTNPITLEEAQYSTFISVQLTPKITSAETQEIGNNRTRPIIMCSFQYKFGTEQFRGISWTIKNETFQKELSSVNMRMPSDIGQSFFSDDEHFMAKWTDVTETGATAILQISQATQEEIEMNFICSVRNSIGVSEKSIRLVSSMSPLMADMIVISGSIAGVLIIVLIISTMILIRCRRKRQEIKQPVRKLTPDLIQHNVNLPPALTHQINHRQDAEINICNATLNRSGRTWSSQKPSSTCSGPDDGYSTERAGDYASSKTESGTRLPNVVLETQNETDSFDGEFSCQSYVAENRVRTERMYSTLQGQSQRSFGQFSTLQTRPQQVHCAIRPSSAQPFFVAPMSESLDDLEVAEPKLTSSESSSDTYNSSNQPLLRKTDVSANVFLQPRPYTARSVSHV